ncbi:MAG: hypothetical protein MJK18_14005, partial [Bdellovibrionales bacterium]|nr:hypothetical protein [Bdellovibrionales bacterium]
VDSSLGTNPGLQGQEGRPQIARFQNNPRPTSPSSNPEVNADGVVGESPFNREPSPSLEPNATGEGDPTNSTAPVGGGAIAAAAVGGTGDLERPDGEPGSSLADQPLPTPDKIMSGQVHGYSLNVKERRGGRKNGSRSGRNIASVGSTGIPGDQSANELAAFKRLMRQKGYIQSRGIASTSSNSVFGDRNSLIFYSMCMHYKFYEMKNNIRMGESRCPKP